MHCMSPKCGCNRHTRRALTHGPVKHGGGGILHLYGEQGWKQMCVFLKYWRCPSQIGSMLRIAHHWAQKQAGVSYSILENTKPALPHVESLHLMSIHNFLGEVDGHTELDTPNISPRQREHDAHTMDFVLESQWFTGKEIGEINHCRLCLGVEMISDVSNTSGVHSDKALVSGEGSLLSSVTKHQKVNQGKPQPSTWAVWRKTLKLFSTNGKLHNRLGDWHFPHNQLHRKWRFHCIPDQDQLFHDNDLEIEHCTTPTHWRRFDPDIHATATAIPSDTLLVSVVIMVNSIRIQGHTPLQISTPTTQLVHDFMSHLRTTPKNDKDLLLSLIHI